MTYRALVLSAVLLVCGSGFDLFRPHTRTRCLPGIPYADYQHGEVSPLVQTISASGILREHPVADQPNVAKKPGLRYFQLDEARIKNGHCFLSQLALTMEKTGWWTLSFRADQNPWFTQDPRGLPPTPPTGPETAPDTNHLKRNQFYIRIRCFVDFPIKEGVPITGKSTVVVLQPPPFWVQRGVPEMGFIEGRHPGLHRFFDVIDRIEVDFYFK